MSLWTQNVNWTSMRHSEDIKDVFWTPYARSVYLLCPGWEKKHPDVRYSTKAAKNGALPFLDIKNEIFVASAYRKEAFSGVYTNLNSWIQLWFIIHLFSLLFLLHLVFFKVLPWIWKLEKVLPETLNHKNSSNNQFSKF